MKERPILFSAPMVLAILEGRKTVTRRLVKVPEGFDFTAGQNDNRDDPANWGGEDENGMWWALASGEGTDFVLPCPYGQPGDRLWVNETFYAFGYWETRYSAKKGRDEWHFVDRTIEAEKAYRYAADEVINKPIFRQANGSCMWWKRPSIFMPRYASRITLEVTGVRVERLQDITEADCFAEGLRSLEAHDRDCRPTGKLRALNEWLGKSEPQMWDDPRNAFRDLWASVNGNDSWGANPWVWVVEFKRVDGV